MSLCNDCPDTNPCAQPCNECLDTNPCYQTGCLNPTTFECLTRPGNWPHIPVTDNMNGLQVMQAIDSKFQQLELSISEIEAGTPSGGDDVKVKVSELDSTGGFLVDKVDDGKHTTVSKMYPGTNERLVINVTPSTMISKDAGNLLHLDSKGLLKVASVSNQKIYMPGDGISFSDAAGTASDPIYINADNTGVQVKRTCFDGIWKRLTLNTISNLDIEYTGGEPMYRIRYDGTVEFKGSATYVVKFGQYTSPTREHVVVAASMAANCLTLTELDGITDLKSIHYIDPAQPSGDIISQQYGYIIRKNNQNIHIEFQSSFTQATSKTIVVTFDGAVFHPNI